MFLGTFLNTLLFTIYNMYIHSLVIHMYMYVYTYCEATLVHMNADE